MLCHDRDLQVSVSLPPDFAAGERKLECLLAGLEDVSYAEDADGLRIAQRILPVIRQRVILLQIGTDRLRYLLAAQKIHMFLIRKIRIGTPACRFHKINIRNSALRCKSRRQRLIRSPVRHR